ncbi:MAG TPA: sigma 54-interacting transcriptional regulator [Geobacteraceae bacterium]
MEQTPHTIAIMSDSIRPRDQLAAKLDRYRHQIRLVRNMDELGALVAETTVSLVVMELHQGCSEPSFPPSKPVLVIIKNCCGTLEISNGQCRGYTEMTFLDDAEREHLPQKVAESLYSIDPQVYLKKQQIRENDDTYFLDGIIGKSRKMREISRSIRRISAQRIAVLLLGETGTGKEVVARAIHTMSLSRDVNRAFVAVNCAAISCSLIESELFGHEKGSFTGADRQHIGKFELADGGTLFLDEIGDMNLEMQAKLLRAVESREFNRVGGKEVVRADVRIISATNKNLLKEVENGRFRKDLYYRLNVDCIELPPLRERKEDIPLLVDHFNRKFSSDSGKVKHISPEALNLLIRYNWPGNIREVRNSIERAVSYCDHGVILPEHLPACIRDYENNSVPLLESIEKLVREHHIADLPDNLIRKIEERLIPEILRKAKSNQKMTAAKLGLAVNTLKSRIKDNSRDHLVTRAEQNATENFRTAKPSGPLASLPQRKAKAPSVARLSHFDLLG